jgi:hypothetical protein
MGPESFSPPPDHQSVDYSELLAQARQPETEVSAEQRRPDREHLTVAFLNTSFGGVFAHPEAVDQLLLQDQQPREQTIVGFSEVTHTQRPAVREALQARGFQVVEPPEESHLDLMWAVSPDLQIAGSDAHHFPRTGLRRVASRTGSEHYRHVGVQDLSVVTAEGNRVRLGQQRLSPWIVEPVRRLQLHDLQQVLEEHYPPDDEALLTINGGDMNHVRPLRRPDDRLWQGLQQREGWQPVLEPGTPTHTSADKYQRSGRVFRALGRQSDETQLDAAYARPLSGVRLVAGAGELGADEIGFETRTVKLAGTDHYAIVTDYAMPVPGEHTKT